MKHEKKVKDGASKDDEFWQFVDREIVKIRDKQKSEPDPAKALHRFVLLCVRVQPDSNYLGFSVFKSILDEDMKLYGHGKDLPSSSTHDNVSD